MVTVCCAGTVSSRATMVNNSRRAPLASRPTHSTLPTFEARRKAHRILRLVDLRCKPATVRRAGVLPRNWLRLVAFGAAVTLLLTACDWTMFGYGPDRTRSSPDNSVRVGGVARLAASWTGATGAAMNSSPAVANGVVYVGSFDHKLYAFDADGRATCNGVPTACVPLWTAMTGAAVFSSPAVAKGVVYVGSQDHKLYAFDAAGTTGCSGIPRTCVPLWTATTGNA